MSLAREHREPLVTDWNATLWVYGVTQAKNNGVFHSCPIAVHGREKGTPTFSRIITKIQETSRVHIFGGKKILNEIKFYNLHYCTDFSYFKFVYLFGFVQSIFFQFHEY